MKMFGNITTANPGEELNVSLLNATSLVQDTVNHNTLLNACVIAISTISMTTCLVSLRIITQCQRMPLPVKYLSANFIVCFLMVDSVIWLHSAVMLWWGDIYYNLLFDSRIFFCCAFAAVLWCSLATITYERLLALLMPLKYNTFTTRTKLIIAIICIWLINVIVPVTIFVVSAVRFCEINDIYLCDVYSLFRPIKVILACLLTTYGFFIVVAYARILSIIFRHQKISKKPFSIQNLISNLGNRLNTLRSTKTVAAIIFAFIILQSPIFVHLVIFEFRSDLQKQKWRVLFQCLDYIAYQLNMYASLYLYIWMFKECRMKLFMLFAKCSTRFQQQANEMRIDVFNIVTIEPKCSTLTQQSTV